jgi:hypothetical protein
MVGAKVRDGGGQPSMIQLLLEKEATEAAKNTLFKPFKMVEVVQGMVSASSKHDVIKTRIFIRGHTASIGSVELLYWWNWLDHCR